MTSLRRIAVFLLLLALPFQAAIGATGLLCVNAAHHVYAVGSIATQHDGGAAAVHSHDGVASDIQHDESSDNNPLHLLGGGPCSACSACCFSAAAIPANPPALVPMDATLKVSVNVDRALMLRAGDDLFRPPRTTTL